MLVFLNVRILTKAISVLKLKHGSYCGNFIRHTESFVLNIDPLHIHFTICIYTVGDLCCSLNQSLKCILLYGGYII